MGTFSIFNGEILRLDVIECIQWEHSISYLKDMGKEQDMKKDITLVEEVAEQDLAQVNGGTLASPFSVVAFNAAAAGYRYGSYVLGNGGGAVCTLTIECQQNCE